jgi:hypothetical protein
MLHNSVVPDVSHESFSQSTHTPGMGQPLRRVIRKLRTDQMASITHTLSESGAAHSGKRSISTRKKVPSSVITSFDGKSAITNPPSPATSTSPIASSPSRGSIPPSTPGNLPIVNHLSTVIVPPVVELRRSLLCNRIFGDHSLYVSLGGSQVYPNTLFRAH